MLHTHNPTRKTIEYPTRASVLTRNPSFTWRVNGGAHRATVAASISLVSDSLRRADVTVSRNFYRGGERTYRNVSVSSLRRVSNLFPYPLFTEAQFERILKDRELANLAAIKAQYPETLAQRAARVHKSHLIDLGVSA